MNTHCLITSAKEEKAGIYEYVQFLESRLYFHRELDFSCHCMATNSPRKNGSYHQCVAKLIGIQWSVSQNAASGAEANIRGLMGLGGGVSCNECQFLVWYELSQG